MENIKENVHNDFVNLKKEKNEYFNQFYSNNYKLVYRICLSILKDVDNSEDIAQTIFEKILKMDESKFPSEYESSWLYTVTKNECLQFIRGQKENQGEEELENVKSDSTEIEDVINSESYERLMKKLNKKQSQIVSLKVESDFTFKEIGQMMSMPIATVQWYYYTSIKSLKAALSSMAMFLIALFIGINYLHNNYQDDEIDSEGAGNKEIVSKGNQKDSSIDQEAHQGGTSSTESVIQNDAKNEKNQNIADFYNVETTSELVQEPNQSAKIKIGIASVCGIFLTLTIIFTIFFIKTQQRRKSKTSKK